MGEHETRVGCEVCKALGNIVRHLQKLTRLHLGLASGPLRRAEDDAGARLKPYPLLRAQKHGRVLAPRRGISRSRPPRGSSIFPAGAPPPAGGGGPHHGRTSSGAGGAPGVGESPGPVSPGFNHSPKRGPPCAAVAAASMLSQAR